MASSSMAATAAQRGRYVHISKPLVTVMGPDGIPRRAVTPQLGTTLKLGRNKAKRALRAGKPRKHWRTLPGEVK